MKANPKPRVRPRKYMTDDGDYLVIDGGGLSNFRIAWHITEWRDIGGTLGEGGEVDPKAAPVDKSQWEVWQAERAVAPLASGCDSDGYYFDTKTLARAALIAANESLISGTAPWPAWAAQAKAAGWKPPKGWKP